MCTCPYFETHEHAICGSYFVSLQYKLAALSSESFNPVISCKQNCSRTRPTNMETCFFLSNCFIKSIETSPSITSKYPVCLRKSSFRLHGRRECMLSSIICCQIGSSSYPCDDRGAVIKSDWKTFRARLVVAERASSTFAADASPSAVDINTVLDYIPQVILRQKWAHRIYEPEKGCLLIATEKLDGVHIFERTVILIVSASQAGLSGIILNKPFLMSIKETKSTVLDFGGTFSNRPLRLGGQVKEEIFLVNTKGNDVNGVEKSGRFKQVMQDLYFGTKESVGFAAEMVKRNIVGVGDVTFFDGYCRWQNDEIRLEINAGFWTMAACNANVIESAGSRGGRLREDVYGLMGLSKVKS